MCHVINNVAVTFFSGGEKSVFRVSNRLGDFFFYFLVYGSSDPNFCILEKKKNFIFDFFYFFRCKKLPDLKKKINIKKR